MEEWPMTPRERYEITIKRDSDRKIKKVVLDFMAEFEREYLFSARPDFGTQTIPKRWVRSIVRVPQTTPIKVA